ncbi:MAG: hypothetical protein IJT68_06310 [Lentisphaeria bacterium]|nr:hypothetical protein [Lentisphaeria bacterium]
MNYTIKKTGLIQIKQNAAVIHWLSESAENNVEADDIPDRLETIAELAEQLAEDARKQAEQFAEDAREQNAILDQYRNPANKEAANA